MAPPLDARPDRSPLFPARSPLPPTATPLCFQTLHAHVDPANLPPFAGGTCQFEGPEFSCTPGFGAPDAGACLRQQVVVKRRSEQRLTFVVPAAAFEKPRKIEWTCMVKSDYDVDFTPFFNGQGLGETKRVVESEDQYCSRGLGQCLPGGIPMRG